MKEYMKLSDMKDDAVKKFSSKPKTRSLLPYLEGGAGAQDTVLGNVSAFSRDKIIPRPLNAGVAGGEISTLVRLPGIEEKVNVTYAAPTAWQGLFHPNGEVATLQGTTAQNALMIVSSFSQTSWQGLIAGNGDEKLSNAFYQMLMIQDESLMLKFMHQAKEAGCGAVVITIDAPNGCTACRVSSGPDRVSLSDMPLLPRWKRKPETMTLNQYLQEYVLDGEYNWKYIEKLVEKSPLPVYIKGISHVKDAKKARKIGAAGIIISNHGGRQMDETISTYDALQIIQDKIQGDIPLLFDGGVRTGIDVLKAIMSGATAVGVGRPIHYGLTLGGSDGVAQVFKILNDELREGMLISGFKNPKKARKKGSSQLFSVR